MMQEMGSDTIVMLNSYDEFKSKGMPVDGNDT